MSDRLHRKHLLTSSERAPSSVIGGKIRPAIVVIVELVELVAVENPCHLPPANGFGTGKMKRYWFDWRAGSCRELTYTGYGGNENNHITKSDCEKRCAS
jgi:hypothetical protein